MNVGIIGTGYVADFYATTMSHHPGLKMSGAYDRNEKTLNAFCNRRPLRAFPSLDALLADPSIELILNLTNPRSHFEITKRCLEAGKHVYSEKPLATDAVAARELAALAEKHGLYLASAPCSLLSETAQTMWKAISDGAIGKVRLVYANFDDGMIAPKMSPWTWKNGCGAPWPAKDEFEVGCTYEHAGYVLTWLAAFFGPAKSVTAYSSCQLPDKGIPVEKMAPDFSVGCIEYADGVVARVTCGLVAPRDKSLTIIGDDGVLTTATVRDDAGPVYLRYIPASRWQDAVERRLNPFRGLLESYLPLVLWSGGDWHFRRKLPFLRTPSRAIVGPGKRVDFCRGPAEMVEAIQQKRPCRLSANLGLHIVELIEALQYPELFDGRRKIEATFAPIEPLPLSS